PGFLFNLFQPSPSLKPLMYTLLEILGKISPDVGLDASHSPAVHPQPPNAQPNTQSSPTPRKIKPSIGGALQLVNILKRRHPTVAHAGARQGALIGLGVALLLTAIASLVFYGVAAYTDVTLSAWAAGLLLLGLGIPLGWLGYTLGILGFGAIDFVKKITEELPQENFFGICTGRQSTHPEVVDKSVLTDWLSSEIDRIAGTSHPLTFGDLQSKTLATSSEDASPVKVGIRLNMVTSNLSQNQPYTLPFETGHLFLFNEDDFKRLFPPNVVEHLKQYGGKQRQSTYQDKSQIISLPSSSSYYFLPDPDMMPIVVAMRMSLSFPLLISAVPLYTIKQSAMAKQNSSPDQTYMLNDQHDLQKNWFSDGGISSNFPIHFFDSWLPSRPTFGVNLASVSEDALITENAHADGTKHLSADNLTVIPNTMATASSAARRSASSASQEDVYLPQIDTVSAPEWIDVKASLPTFLWQIFSTSQNYRDTMQSYLPGYRERIVQVRLTDTEGGLNLAMPQNTIDAVMKKGEDAGKLLCQSFDFKSHKWVRLRVLLGLLDDKLRETYVKALKDDQYQAQALIEQAQAESFPFKYTSPGGADKAKEAIDRIKKSAEVVWNEDPSLNEDQDAPRPRSMLRTTPEF
ncbi:MAG TPA: hypothetical protein V6C57_16405, partial [Coleofasciculaceae cyanobacterium]